MKKLLSLTLLAALSMMLAHGVSLAATGDVAFAQGTVTVVDDREVNEPNDIWMVAEVEGQQVGDWSKTNVMLGDPTITPTQNFKQVLKIKNNKVINCTDESCFETPNPSYVMVIKDYIGDNSEYSSVFVRVTRLNLGGNEVIYEGALSGLESQPFEVGYTYQFPNGTNTSITELEIEYIFAKTAKDSHVQYELQVQEVPAMQ